jgi:hypothetical protein
MRTFRHGRSKAANLFCSSLDGFLNLPDVGSVDFKMIILVKEYRTHLAFDVPGLILGPFDAMTDIRKDP